MRRRAIDMDEVEAEITKPLAPFDRTERREPLRHPARPPGDDAGQRRHHPHRVELVDGQGQARRVRRAREEHRGQRAGAAVQPRLAPRDSTCRAMLAVVTRHDPRRPLRKESAAATPARTTPLPTPSSRSSTSRLTSTTGGNWDSPHAGEPRISAPRRSPTN